MTEARDTPPGAAGGARWRGRQFHNQPVASHTHGFLVDLWDAVRRETAGELDISVHPQNAGIPGSDPQALAMLVAGELEFYTLMGGMIARVVPVAELQGLPFAFSSHAQVHAVMQGALGDYLRSEMASKGIHGFKYGVLENGFRQMVACDRPIRGLEDLAGFRMRIPAGRMFEEFFRALGARPVAVDIRDLYAALAGRKVDGQENPLAIVEVNRLYEVCRYIALTNHMWSGFNLLANLGFWRALPEGVREIVERNVRVHADRQRAHTDRFNRELATKLAAQRGMQFNQPDMKPFRRALTADFYRRWKSELGPNAWKLLEAEVGKIC